MLHLHPHVAAKNLYGNTSYFATKNDNNLIHSLTILIAITKLVTGSSSYLPGRQLTTTITAT